MGSKEQQRGTELDGTIGSKKVKGFESKRSSIDEEV